MPLPTRDRAAALAAAPFASLLLAACATSLQPVADFGGAANRLATVYKPFTTGLADTCEQREHYRALATAGAFDDAVAERDASRRCAELRQGAATAALFGKALAAYASALVKLSSTRPTAFDAELKASGKTVDDLARQDGTPFFDHHQVSAADKIARAAAALVLQARIERLDRATLVDNQEALATVVDAMKVYASRIYVGELQGTQGVMSGELERLKAASAAPQASDVEGRLPWRWAQLGMRKDLADNALQARRAGDFAKSADALLAAHQALIDHWGELDGARRLALVAAFVEEVEALDDEVQAL